MSGTDSGGSLHGRTALVTGAALRIGRRLALALAAQGANVVVHYHRSESAATELATELRTAGVETALLQGDLEDPDVCAGLVARAAAAVGPVDVLVNNASIFEPGDALDTSVDVWRANFAVHATAPFQLSQAFARQLPPGRDGLIVNMNDWRATRPGSEFFAYMVSKAALHALTASLAQALGPRGVRVCELALGAVLPPAGVEGDYLKTSRTAIPTRRFPTVDDVAEALLFLVRTPSISGVTLAVDGGRHLV